MENVDRPRVSRRVFLGGTLALGAAAALGACREDGEGTEAPSTTTSGAGQATAGTALEPTPACADDEPTPTQTEGPFFTPNSPERSSLLADVSSGTKLVLSGSVLATSCQPVARALLDFWQADDQGNYDNEGYRLRGHLFTDAVGRYRLETIVPGVYTGRTRHIHVKVQPPGGRVLTTQLYFPGEAANARDGIFRPELVMQLTDSGGGKAGAFNFVVRT